MGGALETITLTNGRRVRVNEQDKARYARRGLIAGEVAEESAQPMPKAVTLPKRKAKRPAEDKAVKPDADKAKD